jgi:anaerobic sulfite reductase subunit B
MSTLSDPSHREAPWPEPPLAPSPYTVLERTTDTADTATLRLRPNDGHDCPAFRPGQFNMVSILGRGEAAISISGDPDRRDEVVHTIRTAGLATQALAGAAAGTTVAVRGPYGTGWPIDLARGQDIVLIAGGLGLAPLRPLLYEVLRHRDRFGRVEVIYGARTPADLVYYPELQTWRGRTDARFQVTVDAAGRDWYGDVGLVTLRIPDARFDGPNTVAYLCGPEVMMRFAAEALEARGVRRDQIWVSLERNMKCGIGQCGHCQLGPYLLCRDGPVLRYREVGPLLRVRGL